jgi:hypothetical protein
VAKRDVGPTDPVARTLDMIAGYGFRDSVGLPLGDVYGHALRRLKTSYAIIEAAHLGAAFGQVGHGDGIPPQHKFFPGAARVQDRSGIVRYPAAHIAPCTLTVGSPGVARKDQPALYQIFAHPITTEYTTELFRKTDIVHRLTNHADWLHEGTAKHPGMSQILAESCNLMLADPYHKPREVFHEKFLPAFRQHAQHLLSDCESALPGSAASDPDGLLDRFGNPFNARLDPETAPGAGLVDRFGRPFDWDPDRSDTRVGKNAPLEVRRTNLPALGQILGVYVTAQLPASDEKQVAEHARGVKANEESEARGRARERARRRGT